MDPNKAIKYSHYQISDKVENGGLMDSQACKDLAGQVMQLYDSNGDGYIDSIEIGYMMSDCYRAMNKGFNPTPTDVASFARVLDSKLNKLILQKTVAGAYIATISKRCA